MFDEDHLDLLDNLQRPPRDVRRTDVQFLVRTLLLLLLLLAMIAAAVLLWGRHGGK